MPTWTCNEGMVKCPRTPPRVQFTASSAQPPPHASCPSPRGSVGLAESLGLLFCVYEAVDLFNMIQTAGPRVQLVAPVNCR